MIDDLTAIIATYPSHAEAQDAVKELERAKFDLRKLSIVGRNHRKDEPSVGSDNVGDRMKGMGIPVDSILRHEMALKTGKYLVIFHGRSDEAERARDVIRQSQPETMEEHEFSHSNSDG